MFPEKLKQGDEIRVISPAESLAIVAEDQKQLAVQRMTDAGFIVTFSTYADEHRSLHSNPIEHRISDLHEAFLDPAVKAVWTTLGGYDSNQLLRYIDYELIGRNPKIFCGYSDITALSSSIYKQTGLVTYNGPHFSTFGMKSGTAYTFKHFIDMMTSDKPISITPADHWSDDLWYINQEDRTFHPNPGCIVLNEGEAEGISLGGNLCTLNLLQGTEYMPALEGTVLFLEDDKLTNAGTFDRDLQSLLHQPGFDKVQGIVFGKFQEVSDITDEQLTAIIRSKRELDHIPIIAGASFGHTTPMFTFPIGGRVRISTSNESPCIEILKH
ncbi:S66 peptidase family protein [Halobacillus sp. KGW1]|uniref:S66 family peptidase n=1 Tax=Halobacillus sp. KGW1 TaxID=1793726 RepID=UPI00078169B7|nr:S66 peptidase family protein [Halobacillus sp. KGW1]